MSVILSIISLGENLHSCSCLFSQLHWIVPSSHYKRARGRSIIRKMRFESHLYTYNKNQIQSNHRESPSSLNFPFISSVARSPIKIFQLKVIEAETWFFCIKSLCFMLHNCSWFIVKPFVNNSSEAFGMDQ